MKKNGKPNKPGLNQYATGLDTFSQYLALPTWNEIEIAKRADFLFNKALIVWKE
jgi:hypothetical protein